VKVKLSLEDDNKNTVKKLLLFFERLFSVNQPFPTISTSTIVMSFSKQHYFYFTSSDIAGVRKVIMEKKMKSIFFTFVFFI
jgi:hypothetical protein